MTRDECKHILMIIDATYPNFVIEDLKGTINAWYVFLKDYDYNIIEAGLKIYVMTAGSAFAPSVSELIAAARKPLELQRTDAVTAWNQVRKAIRNSLYNSGEEFEKLPEEAKKVVGSPTQLYTWAQLESKEIDTVVWSNFKKSYETNQARAREIAAIPQSVLKVIEDAKVSMIEGS